MAEYRPMPVGGESYILGTGTFGQVEKVQRKKDQKIFACKTIPFDGSRSGIKQYAAREVKILSQLKHPNIVRYVDVLWGSQQAKLYMEFCRSGTLHDLIERNAVLEPELEEYVWSIVFQLASALAYTHEGKILDIVRGEAVSRIKASTVLHRDIKPKNVFLSSESETALDAIKLGDLGLGVILLPDKDPTTYLGTRRYMPPEISKKKSAKWTTACDIFSFGCTLYELYEGDSPYEDHPEWRDDHVKLVSDAWSEGLKQLINECIFHEEKARPPAGDILQRAQQNLKGNKSYETAVLDLQLLEGAEKGELENVRNLLGLEAEIGARAGSNREGVLHREARSGNIRLLQFLIERDADITARDANDDTPLHCAATAGHDSAVNVLLDKGATMNAFNDNGWTAFHIAAAQNHCRVVDAFAEKNLITDIDIPTARPKSYTPLHLAALNDCESMIGHLLDLHANTEVQTSDGRSALHLAAESGHVLVVKALLERGAQVDRKVAGEKTETPLHLAASCGYVATVSVLLNGKANIDALAFEGKKPLHAAALRGHKSVIGLLSKEGADIAEAINGGKRNGYSAIHLASEGGHASAVRLILENEVNANTRDASGHTAMHWAAGLGHGDVVSELLAYGADVDIQAHYLATPLHWAAREGQLEMARTLINAGAPLEGSMSNGQTALHVAADNGQDEMVQELIDQGAKIEAKDGKGQTSLHLAAQRRAIKAVHVLLREVPTPGPPTRRKRRHWRLSRTVRVVLRGKSSRCCRIVWVKSD